MFLDRDGTILDELGYLGKPEDMRIYPFAAEALRTLQAAGYRLVVVTNQSGVGRGYFGEEDALAVNLAMVQRLAEEGVRLDAVLYCPHPPDGGCSCRKPATLMIQRAADDLGVDPKASWMVGDTGTDAAAGANGGTRAIVVGTGKAEKGDIPSGALVLPDLARAASFIAGEGRR